MKTAENIKKFVSKITDDGNVAVAGIFFVYMSMIILSVIYSVDNRDSYELLRGHRAKSETSGEEFGAVIARAKENDGYCEYRACDETNKICDWYDNSNRECNNMNKGDWVAKVGNKLHTGTSLCSETAGEFAKIGIPSQNKGAYCWCKSGKNWVGNLFLDTPSYCSGNGCAGDCAHSVLYSPAFRSALNAKTQNTK